MPDLAPCPPYLYRYLSLRDDQRKEWARGLIVDRSIYFSRPSEFNDPCECSFELDLDAPDSQRLNGLTAYFQRAQGLDLHKARSKAEKEIAKGWYFSSKHRQYAAREIRNWLLKSAGMVCLSATNNNALMWAHYADGHKGVCVELDMSPDKWYNWQAGPHAVEYCDQQPIVSWFTDTRSQILQKTVLRKATDWKHEEEWRFYDPSLGGKTQTLPDAISAIIVGMRASDDTVALVRK